MFKLLQTEAFASNTEYWSNMNKLLDTKCNNFKQKFKNGIIEEVKQITDPLEKEMKGLVAENKKT